MSIDAAAAAAAAPAARTSSVDAPSTTARVVLTPSTARIGAIGSNVAILMQPFIIFFGGRYTSRTVISVHTLFFERAQQLCLQTK
jgi:hypothetical protein